MDHLLPDGDAPGARAIIAIDYLRAMLDRPAADRRWCGRQLDLAGALEARAQAAP